MKDQILDTWKVNNRVNLMLLDAISDEGLACTLSKRGGGTPGKQFRHMHNLRCWRLERCAPDLHQGQTKISPEETHEKALLETRLTESADCFAQWIELAIEAGGQIKGFKRGVVPMIGYFIAHEAHHRGNILLTLKQSGHKLPRDFSYKLWAWNQI